MTLPVPIPRADILAARARIAPYAVRTPLVRLHVDAPCEVWLKLETLQPIASFKIRGAANAMALADSQRLQQGVWTASAGNMAQGVAWCARERGIPCTVVVPHNAPDTKLAAVERLGGRIVRVPYLDWWQILVNHGDPSHDGVFIHPVADAAVIAGNGTMGLEILEELEGVDAIVAPYGGGGLACGLACAVDVPVLAAEVETAAPLTASLAAGHAMEIDHQPSFVDGMGGRSVLDAMWPLASQVLAGAIVVSLHEVASAIRLLVERTRVVAEGAGAAAVAAALTGKAGSGRVVCVVSGGNIDTARLQVILSGRVP